MGYAQRRGTRWTAYYRTPEGKKKSAGTYDTENEALDAAQRAEDAGIVDGDIYDPTQTLAAYVERWMPTAELGLKTKRDYMSSFRKHILPVLGQKRLNQITRRDVRILLSKLKASGASANVLRNVRAAIGSAYKPLTEVELIEISPSFGISLPRPARKLDKVIDIEGFKKILKSLPTDEWRVFAKFMIGTGLRYSEATAVRVIDLDFETGNVLVRKRWVEAGAELGNGSRFVEVPATKGGESRVSKMSSVLANEVSEYIKHHGLTAGDLLFPETVLDPGPTVDPTYSKGNGEFFTVGPRTFEHGTPYAYGPGRCRCDACTESMRLYRRVKRFERKGTTKRLVHRTNITGNVPREKWSNVWHPAVEAAGFDWRPKPHNLRHAYATTLLKAGVDIHTVKELMGHASVTTTEFYLHHVRASLSKASDAMDDFLE